MTAKLTPLKQYDYAVLLYRRHNHHRGQIFLVVLDEDQHGYATVAGPLTPDPNPGNDILQIHHSQLHKLSDEQYRDLTVKGGQIEIPGTDIILKWDAEKGAAGYGNSEFVSSEESSEKVYDPKDNLPSSYPDDNPKTVMGSAKPSLHAIPPIALLHLGQAMADGKQKYGLTNWREKRVSGTVYFDAMVRHLLAWWDGENVAADSQRHHLAHVMACCAIILDADSLGKLNDDRPSVPGKAAEFIAENTKTI